MKRQAIVHPKMKRLCRLMDIPVWQGVGLLEMIWQLTAREAPRGDIGKLTDEEIALAIDYRGDETKLIEALVQAGWLDRDPAERLVVHGWHEHCEDAVHMRLARARLHFVGGYAPKLGRLPAREREALAEFYDSCSRSDPPRPTACAQNEDSCSRNGQDGSTPDCLSSPVPSPEAPDRHVRPRFEDVWQAWPKKENRDRAAQDWACYATFENERDVMACAERYLASDEVSRGEVKQLYQWLEQQHRAGWTGNWPPARKRRG